MTISLWVVNQQRTLGGCERASIALNGERKEVMVVAHRTTKARRGEEGEAKRLRSGGGRNGGEVYLVMRVVGGGSREEG